MGQRAGFGCSFSTLALQVVQGIISGEMYSADKVFITRVMDMLVNLLIGQHLPVRVYASVRNHDLLCHHYAINQT